MAGGFAFGQAILSQSGKEGDLLDLWFHSTVAIGKFVASDYFAKLNELKSNNLQLLQKHGSRRNRNSNT